MNRCVIFGGADMTDMERIRRSLREDDFIICCDSGLKYAEQLSLHPDLIVGDFDSHQRPETRTETIVLPRERTIRIRFMLPGKPCDGDLKNIC